MWLRGVALLLFVALAQIVLCAPEYYKILDVSKKASDKELKTAYRKLSKKYHPDKNPGDETAQHKFLEVSEAYDILSDAESRQIYDKYGYDAVQKHTQGGGASHHHDPYDLFNSFFGGGGHFRNDQKPGPRVEVRIGIALRDFYNGKTTEFQWEKQHICEKCEGTGSEDGKSHRCDSCQGRGIKIVKHQLAPGIFQQMQAHCDVCGGRGNLITHKCTLCDGNKVIRKATTVPLTVARGILPGAQLVYENEADASPDYPAGDLIVHLVEKEPSLDEDNPDKVDGVFFRRKDNDLYWTEVLSLREAWMGDWTRNLTHLDGRIVTLKRERGQVVQPGHVETVANEGMPKYHEEGDSVYHKTEFGSLFVEYVIVLPDQMESGMEKEFWSVWQKWKGKVGTDLHKDSGRPDKPIMHEEL